MCSLLPFLFETLVFGMRNEHCCDQIMVKGMGQNSVARAIEISRFFLVSNLMDPSEMNYIVDFIDVSVHGPFLFRRVCFHHSNRMQSVPSAFAAFYREF